MEKKERIRLDFIGKSGVKFTKSSVVAAVRLLEQRPDVTLKGTFRDIVEWANSSLFITRKESTCTLGICWNDPDAQEAISTFKVDMAGQVDYRPISEVLPLLISNLILKTDKVELTEVKDEFA